MATTEFITEINKYFAYASLLMPGVIMITLRRWVTPINTHFFSQEILRFIGYGFFNLAMFLIILKLIHFNLNFEEVFNICNIQKNLLIFLLYTFILPVILGLILCFFDKKRVVNRLFKKFFGIDIETHIATVWEEKFSLGIGNYVNITLKNNEIIKGYFGTNSLVSSYMEKKDMYLERVISINNKEVSTPTSMWIDGNEIVHIDFLSELEPKKNSCIDILAKIYVLLAKIYREIRKG